MIRQKTKLATEWLAGLDFALKLVVTVPVSTTLQAYTKRQFSENSSKVRSNLSIIWAITIERELCF